VVKEEDLKSELESILKERDQSFWRYENTEWNTFPDIFTLNDCLCLLEDLLEEDVVPYYVWMRLLSGYYTKFIDQDPATEDDVIGLLKRVLSKVANVHCLVELY